MPVIYGASDDHAADSHECIHGCLVRDDITDYHTGPERFPLGQLVATPNALRLVSQADIQTALTRHVRGDWGDLDAHDTRANNQALEHGGRLLSAYNAANGTCFWIITEADRSATTVLLPGDY